jgi:hypothetical protein
MKALADETGRGGIQDLLAPDLATVLRRIFQPLFYVML